MRSIGFIIFFSIVMLIYGSVNYYLYIRGLQLFSLNQSLKRWYIVIFWTVVASFIAGSILERSYSSAFSEWVYRVGSFWLAFMLYLLMAALVVDLIRVANYFFHFLPLFTPQIKFKTGLAILALISVIIVAGHINAITINIKQIPLTIRKSGSDGKPIKILMASDIHLGALIGERREEKLLKIVREQKPDLVLLCGDLVDGEIAPVLRKNLGRHIQEIDAPLGVWAIPGNHEYIGGFNKTIPYLKSINIRILQDEVVTLPNGIQLVGRDDRSGTPKPLEQLLATTDSTKPIIVMNHQPFRLDEVTGQHVDLHLSGHTHNGQLWPFNYVTKAMFELSWGLKEKAGTTFYVSSGYGTWGPPVRTGNRPEVVIFNVKFENK